MAGHSGEEDFWLRVASIHNETGDTGFAGTDAVKLPTCRLMARVARLGQLSDDP